MFAMFTWVCLVAQPWVIAAQQHQGESVARTGPKDVFNDMLTKVMKVRSSLPSTSND